MSNAQQVRRGRRRERCTGRLVVALAVGAGGCASEPGSEVPDGDPAGWSLEVSPQTSGTDALLQAVSPVDEWVVWVSGHDGTFGRTTDGGRTWSFQVMAGEETLQFRDVAAFGADTAYLMSSGTGSASRIYRTEDGGSTWTLQYTADHPEAFLDCLDFWDPDHGLVFGDAVDEAPFILWTDDGGDTWTRIAAEALPAVQEGEGGFAASGTCLVTGADGRAWIATGNAERARVLLTRDGGTTWEESPVPVVAGTGAGLMTIQVDESGRGIALGGVVGGDSLRTENVAMTRDHGVTWEAGGPPAMAGPVYGSAWVSLPTGPVAVAVGPRGMAWSPDGGASWQPADSLTYWAVAFPDGHTGWAVGPDGRIVRLAFVPR